MITPFKTPASPKSPTTPQSALKKAAKPEAGKVAADKKIGYAKKVMTKKEAITTATPGLTQEQKDYEPTTAPKHYRPDQKEHRVTRLAEIEEERRRRKFDPAGAASTTSYTKGWAPSEECFVVTSFNDWMPIKLKTMRTLALEKHRLTEDRVPKTVFMMDHHILLYAAMAPPGQHFFYFVRESGEMFLSPRYEIVRFKSTTVYLNRLVIEPRIAAPLAIQAVKREEEEAVFMKDRSVFKDFRDDTVVYIRKCLD